MVVFSDASTEECAAFIQGKDIVFHRNWSLEESKKSSTRRKLVIVTKTQHEYIRVASSTHEYIRVTYEQHRTKYGNMQVISECIGYFQMHRSIKVESKGQLSAREDVKPIGIGE